MAASAAGDAGSGNAGWDLLGETGEEVTPCRRIQAAEGNRGFAWLGGDHCLLLSLFWKRELVLLKGEIRISPGNVIVAGREVGMSSLPPLLEMISPSPLCLRRISCAATQLQLLVYNGGLLRMASGPGTDRDPPQLMIKWQRVGHLCGSYPLPWSSLLTAIPTGTRSNRLCSISLWRSAMCLSVLSGPLMDVMTTSESMYRSSISHPAIAEILGNDNINGRSHLISPI